MIRAPGPAGALGHVDLDDPSNQPAVRKARQWSPGVILQWYFGHAQSKFRPFVGVGVVYSFFTNIELNPNFSAAVNRELGGVLAAGAGKPGPTYVEGKSSASWSAIFNLGIDGHGVIPAAQDGSRHRDQGSGRLYAGHHQNHAQGQPDHHVRWGVVQVLVGCRLSVPG